VWRGGLAWAGPDELLCSQPESVAGAQTATSSRITLLHVPSGRTRPLLSSPANIPKLDILGPGRLLLEAGSLRQNLREIPLRSSGPGERWLTHGNGADRQPIYAPDGEWIAFSSNRSGNLDIWANRTGQFEVWLAAADGSGARQVTRDGVAVENPVATPDGRWFVYASANPSSRGIMKIRPDGSGSTLLVPGNMFEPEVSPDGRYVAFVADVGSERATLRVARMADGSRVPFEVPGPRLNPGGGIDEGRCRWLRDGRGLAYSDRARDGSYAVYVQEFAPGAGARGSRRRLTGLEPGLDAESLGVSPDGVFLTVSFREQLFDLMVAEGVPGIEGARRAP